MQKAGIGILSAVIIGLVAIAIALGGTPTTQKEYLRIHIRANSNSEYDQSVKYKVKDEVVAFLTPFIAECDTKAKAEKTIEENLEKIEKVADGVLKKNGCSYSSAAKIENEKFPTRTYEELTLGAGYYDALIIYLGDGQGDNWWCVVYPPLCFTEGAGYIYESKIVDIINDFTKKFG